MSFRSVSKKHKRHHHSLSPIVVTCSHNNHYDTDHFRIRIARQVLNAIGAKPEDRIDVLYNGNRMRIVAVVDGAYKLNTPTSINSTVQFQIRRDHPFRTQFPAADIDNFEYVVLDGGKVAVEFNLPKDVVRR